MNVPVEQDPNHVELPLNPAVYQAIQVIKNTYGDTVSIAEKQKSLLKFGRNDSITTGVEETVWLVGGFETYPTDNTIDTIFSSDEDDDQDVIVEGHTLVNGELVFVSQMVTLDGTNDVTLTTPLFRANRLYNNSGTDFAGTVTVEEATGSVPHLSTSGSNNQSLKCATSLSKDDYWIITGVAGSVNRQNSRSVDFKFQIREYGKVFRTRLAFSGHTNAGTNYIQLDPPLIMTPNSDMRVNAISSGTTTGVEAFVNGYLASIIT